MVARVIVSGVLAAAILIVFGMAHTAVTGRPVDTPLRSLQTAPVEAASRHTMRTVRMKARRIARKWCRVNNMNARLPLGPGVTHLAPVSRCREYGVVRGSCWFQARYRTGECGIWVRVWMHPPFHGHPGYEFRTLRRCYDSALLRRRDHTRIIDARQELDPTCYEDLDAGLQA